MFAFRKILLLSFLFTLASSSDLSSGFYHNIDKKDSIEVSVKKDKIDLKLSTGSKLIFHLDNGNYKMQNLSGDGFTAIKIGPV